MENPKPEQQPNSAFSQSESDGLYKAIYERRDVRGQFKPDPIANDKLARILDAAHHAPSVGFMQPWNFLLIESAQIKKKIHQLFVEANAEAALQFEDKSRKLYSSLKLEGILEAPINLCVTCDRSRSGPVVLGRTHDLAMDLYSTVCAAQNLWLAARAEGVGVGWVSIFDKGKLKDLLGLPDQVVPVAYLCMGEVEFFHKNPELQTAGWRDRLPLEDLIYYDSWGNLDLERSRHMLSQRHKPNSEI